MDHDLRLAVEALREWVAKNEHLSKSAEWESEYPEWAWIWSVAEQFMAAKPVAEWTAEEMEGILYAIARDNELEVIADAAAENANTLIAVARAALEKGHRDARWQLAARIGAVVYDRDESIWLLSQFINDQDEYVRRRALIALGDLRAEEVEACSERAWATGEEYQRIAALHVLAKIGSARLDRYLLLANEDGREYVLAAAERARVGGTDSPPRGVWTAEE